MAHDPAGGRQDVSVVMSERLWLLLATVDAG